MTVNTLVVLLIGIAVGSYLAKKTKLPLVGGS